MFDTVSTKEPLGRLKYFFEIFQAVIGASGFGTFVYYFPTTLGLS
jgi:hypothetical protein